ncbi:MAG: FadR family transcriptional regulator [Chrysiogenetes bacterium]|nr:FadR family transcriptional regulator [Chrysiogenetes bacterium]
MPELAANPLRRESVVDEITQRIQSEILDGTYAPGGALPPERELAGRYGVTRTSVKHALVRLEQQGLIRTRHGVGSIVQDIEKSGGADLLKYLAVIESTDSGLYSEILEARSVIVAAFAKLAAERIDGAQTAELEKLYEKLRPITDYREAEKLEIAFFRVLANATGNRAVTLVMNSVSAASGAGATEAFASPLRDHDWLIERLGAILGAIKKKNAAATQAAVERYMSEHARRMLESGNTASRKERK